METIVIEANSKADRKFWLDLAKKTGAKAKSFNTEDLEDRALAKLIEKGLKSEEVDRNSVMKALGR